MQQTQVRSLGQEDSLEKGMATHSSILAWRIPRTEESGRLQYMRSQRVRHDWSDLAAVAADLFLDFLKKIQLCFKGNWRSLNMKCILDNITVATLHFLDVTVVLWICKRMSIFSRYILKHLEVTCHDIWTLFHCLQKEKVKLLYVEKGWGKN